MEDDKLPKEMHELKPMHKMEPTVTVKKSTVLQGLCVVLVILLALSVWTGGFGFGTETTGAVVADPTANPTENPTADAKVQSIPVSGAPVLGDKNAPVTIVEFSDFQCPYCSKGKTTLDSLVDKYVTPGKVKIIFKDFPLSFHANAQAAAEAARAAGEQGKFWEMYNKIFDNQAAWSSATDAKTIFEGYATDIGLDTAKWEASYDSSKFKDAIAKDQADGTKIGVTGTPTFFIGNDKDGYTPIVGAYPAEAFQTIIDGLLAA